MPLENEQVHDFLGGVDVGDWGIVRRQQNIKPIRTARAGHNALIKSSENCNHVKHVMSTCDGGAGGNGENGGDLL